MIDPTCQTCGGQCCKFISVRVGLQTPERRTWFEARGNLTPGGTWRISSRCPHLTADNRCAIYATRPRACRDWPVDGDGCRGTRAAAATANTTGATAK